MSHDLSIDRIVTLGVHCSYGWDCEAENAEQAHQLWGAHLAVVIGPELSMAAIVDRTHLSEVPPPPPPLSWRPRRRKS